MVRKHNPDNERIKRKYLIFQKEARQQSEATIDAYAKSLARFEDYSGYRDFKKFHFEQAIGFKRHLATQLNQSTHRPLSKSTINGTLNQVKRFFEWLSQQPGYRSRLNYCDAEYFNLSEKDTRIAAASKPKPYPTLEQIKHTLESMPADSPIELRNRALMAFTILTGTRDSAMASMSLKHIDVHERCVFQDAREVKTKFSKSFMTYFFPIGDDIYDLFYDWVVFLREEFLWGESDPLFPATEIGLSLTHQFEPIGLKREHWRTASPIRDIFKVAFENAGLPYFNPHSFRNTLVIMAEQRCQTPEEFKAWSQNLGHESVLTTFLNYGEVSLDRQKLLLLENPVETQTASEIQRIATQALLAIQSIDSKSIS